MPPRIEGPDPPKPVWTAKRVRLSLIAGWREGRRPAFMGRGSSARSAIDWASMFLPADDPASGPARTYLLTWVMVTAEGDSFRERVRARGWKRTTVFRAIDWAIEQIVDGLNEEHRIQNNR